jgi:hypothetical protein
LLHFPGTTPEKFIQKDSTGKSPYDKFRERLATILNTDKENAKMISVRRGVVWRSMSRTSPQQGSTEQNICECLTTQLNITYPGFVFHNNSIHLANPEKKMYGVWEAFYDKYINLCAGIL